MVVLPSNNSSVAAMLVRYPLRCAVRVIYLERLLSSVPMAESNAADPARPRYLTPRLPARWFGAAPRSRLKIDDP